jgi:branched-chain amino acid transport system substrate-binding protein
MSNRFIAMSMVNNDRRSDQQDSFRRSFLRGAVGTGTILLAGCLSGQGNGGSNGSGGSGSNGSGSGGSNDSSGAKETIKIGAIYPLSGSLASIGATCQKGWKFGTNWVNNHGGIELSTGTANFELVFGDSQSKQSVGVSEAKRLINQEDVDMLAGCYQSTVTLPVSQVAERNQIPFYSPISVANKITERGFDYLLRQNVKAAWIGRDFVRAGSALAQGSETKIQEVGLLYENTDYGQSSADGVRQNMGEYAPETWKITADYAYPNNTSSVDSVISKLKKKNPDILFGVHYLQDGVLIANTMKKLNWQPKMYLISGAASDPGYIENVGSTALGFMPAGGWNIKTVNDKVVTSFANNYKNRISYYSGFPFTAANVIRSAIEKVGNWDPDKFMQAAKELKFKGDTNVMAKPINFKESGQNKNASRLASQFQMENGKINKPVLWPSGASTGQPIIPIPPFSKK